MFKKPRFLYMINDQTLRKKYKKVRIFYWLVCLIVMITTYHFTDSLFAPVIALFILKIGFRTGITPKFQHHIIFYAECFHYVYRKKIYVIEYGQVGYIDQDVFEIKGFPIYNKLILYTDEMVELVTINGRYFSYEDLVDFCTFIQDTNLSSRYGYFNRNEQFYSAVTQMDQSYTIEP